MEILLGIGAALTYGAGDFFGGLVTRRAHVLYVVFWSHVIGLVLVLPTLLVVEGNLTGKAAIWGILSGFAGGTGVVLLYSGLARGRMSVIAPTTAVLAAVVPVGFGLMTGERPSAVALIGVLVALGAVGLVSAAPDPGTPGGGAGTDDPEAKVTYSGIVESLGAGVAFGIFFIALTKAGTGTGMYPIAFARVGSLALVGLAILITKPSRVGTRESMFGIAIAGLADVLANVLYLLASREGLLSLVAVLTSMYPASTVLLARTVLKERFVPTQMVGLVLAVAAVTLIATG